MYLRAVSTNSSTAVACCVRAWVACCIVCCMLQEDPSLKFEPQVDLAALPEVKPVTNEEDEEATFKE